ncbi:hypothetical protein MMH89_00470 [Candidatus Comchoanobacter bicostacola]|uniref:DUF4240 domain-containing protein n=1 Tax=Candidatus Comchoanobacter bicostacola TaxID=2919598 RepID=A0ABY5DLI5_9GAMM|nr:hypothetical protein [Candidatus Comchoanobacter bicostacola]UTC24640.1 hypothetical protein MMH89_00470 [Candidatus Comchoanobacter bicostacola]
MKEIGRYKMKVSLYREFCDLNGKGREKLHGDDLLQALKGRVYSDNRNKSPYLMLLIRYYFDVEQKTYEVFSKDDIAIGSDDQYIESILLGLSSIPGQYLAKRDVDKALTYIYEKYPIFAPYVTDVYQNKIWGDHLFIEMYQKEAIELNKPYIVRLKDGLYHFGTYQEHLLETGYSCPAGRDPKNVFKDLLTQRPWYVVLYHKIVFGIKSLFSSMSLKKLETEWARSKCKRYMKSGAFVTRYPSASVPSNLKATEYPSTIKNPGKSN